MGQVTDNESYHEEINKSIVKVQLHRIDLQRVFALLFIDQRKKGGMHGMCIMQSMLVEDLITHTVVSLCRYDRLENRED